MDRRTFTMTSAGAAASLPAAATALPGAAASLPVAATSLPATAAALPAAAAAPKKGIFELRFFRLRNSADNQAPRVSDFLKNALLPAAERNGFGPVGVFRNLIGGAEGPFIMLLTGYPSLAAWENLGADSEFVKQVGAFNAQPGLGYMRMESSLLRGFASMPAIEVPPTDAKRPGRIFEVRTYESNNLTTLHRKMKMFDDGEIGIFRRAGMQPVFFGETIVGRNMPNLTYMLGYDDLAHRDKTWRAFGGDPEWQKMRALPGLSDAEVVSNITNFLVSPLPFSPIR